jgi:uncharacterized membrane protein
MDFCTLVLWFGLYSVLGWAYESAFCTLQNRHWHNRGVLISPCCPIYGFGAVLAVLLCRGMRYPAGVFVTCMAGSAVLEYATAVLLEKGMHVKSWDYSNYPLNLKGRICLPAALCFGVGGLIVIYGIQPLVEMLTTRMPLLLRQGTALTMVALLSADVTLTLTDHVPLAHAVQSGKARLDGSIERKYRTIYERLHDDDAA